LTGIDKRLKGFNHLFAVKDMNGYFGNPICRSIATGRLNVNNCVHVSVPKFVSSKVQELHCSANQLLNFGTLELVNFAGRRRSKIFWQCSNRLTNI
jgi:hypothetical protein